VNDPTIICPRCKTIMMMTEARVIWSSQGNWVHVCDSCVTTIVNCPIEHAKAVIERNRLDSLKSVRHLSFHEKNGFN
jgi:hypothetical protein